MHITGAPFALLFEYRDEERKQTIQARRKNQRDQNGKINEAGNLGTRTPSQKQTFILIYK